MVTAVCALVIAVARSGPLFSIAIVGWGFVFFMGVPAAFTLLASRSNFPEERAGDAQAVMALGRVFGPLLGGALYATGSTGTLGLVAAAVMMVGSALLLYVDRQRFVVVRQFGAWQANRASVDTTQHA
jgi:DHA1 family inner membrane transport protein